MIFRYEHRENKAGPKEFQFDTAFRNKTRMAMPVIPLRVLLVDDDPSVRKMVSWIAEKEGYEPHEAGTAEEALEILGEINADLIVLDWHLPGMSGLTALDHFYTRAPAIPVIMLTAETNLESAVEAMKAGAGDYLTKPVDATRLRLALRRAMLFSEERRRRRNLEVALEQVARHSSFPEIRSCSPAMKPVFRLMERVLDRNLPVLIQGESGTGKELVAQAIHSRSRRRKGPFVVLNCAAIPESLVESELFGHEKGAFTGAAISRPGHIELADQGTLFLDEVGELPLSIQPKFLRCLQDGRVQRVGGSQMRSVNFRLISATNRDLTREVKDGRFREDLFYRLAVFPIRLPPLRERREDIVMLARHFLDASDRPKLLIEPSASDVLNLYPWPGNVRELQNLMARLAVLVEGDRLTREILMEHFNFSRVWEKMDEGASELDSDAADATSPESPGSAPNPPADAAAAEMPSGAIPRRIPTPPAGAAPRTPGRPDSPSPRRAPTPSRITTLAEVERRAIEDALVAFRGNVTEAAQALGIGRATLYRYIRKHDMTEFTNHLM